MTRKIIVHAGLGKCGSTSIQEGMRSHRNLFLEEGFTPYVHGDFGLIRPTALSFYHDHVLPFEEKFKNQAPVDVDVEKNAEMIRDQIENSEGIPLVSSEWFLDSHFVRAKKRLHFLDKIVKYFDEVDVIIYFRAPDELLRSLYIQWFFPEFPVDFDKFISHFDFMNPDEWDYTLDIKKQVQLIQNELKNATIKLRPLEDVVENQGLFKDFCATVGITDGLGELREIHSKRSVNSGIFGLLYTLRNQLELSTRSSLFHFLKNEKFGIDCPSYLLLDRSLRTQILNFYRKDIEAVSEEYNLDLTVFFSKWENRIRNSEPDLSKVKNDLLREAIVYMSKNLI